MITKSLLALSIVASTLIGATAPASALIAVAIIAAKQAPASGVAIVHPDYKAAGSSVRDDKPSRSRDKKHNKQKRGSKKRGSKKHR